MNYSHDPAQLTNYGFGGIDSEISTPAFKLLFYLGGNKRGPIIKPQPTPADKADKLKKI